MASGKLLPTLVFSVLFGVALAGIGEQARPIVGLLEAIMAAMFRLTRWIIALSPLAILAIMAYPFATQGLAAVLGLAKLVGLMYVGLVIEIGIFCVILAGMSERPLHVFRRILEPLLLAFTTRSSEVTLPVHMKILQEMGISDKIVSVVLPLGYSFNQDGSILYQALAVTFMAEAYDVTLDTSALLTILLTVLIASKGGANIPSGSLVVLATVLTAIGLPVEAIAGRRCRRVHGYGSYRHQRPRQHGRDEACQPLRRPRGTRGSALGRRPRRLKRLARPSMRRSGPR